VHEGTVFRWRNDNVEETAATQYGRTTDGEARRHLATQSLLSPAADRRRGTAAAHRLRRSDRLRQHPGDEGSGYTDNILFVRRFAEGATIGEMDCRLLDLVVARTPRVSATPISSALRRLAPTLDSRPRAAGLAEVADTLVEVYLGRDAGQRVLKGRIQRGVADRIEAALWFSDLRSFTTITDTAKPSEIIPLLNDYAEAGHHGHPRRRVATC
jgi:adenylate cyclase